MSGKPGQASRVTAGGITNVVSASVTRPADTTTYAIGDVVSNSTSAAVIMSFTAAAFEGGGGVINAASLIDSTAASTKPEFDLYLFDTTVVMENDNAAWDPSDLEMETCIGVISFLAANFKISAVSGGLSNGITQVQNIGLPFTCLTGSQTLYGIAVARNAYVPVSGEKFTFRLNILQD